MVNPPYPPQPQSNQPSERLDISQRAIRLGRILDRMARGKYIILVDVGASEWSANILSESTLSKIATVMDANYREKKHSENGA